MKKSISLITAAIMAVTTFSATAIPASAQSFGFGIGRDGMNVQVQSNDRGFHRRGNDYFYNGHRGYRDRRPGYRYHNGWWFPPAAFVFGSIIGGAIASGIANEARRGGNWNAHVAWCHDRYRSYRSSDNTFQPYNGPRQQCFSPYS